MMRPAFILFAMLVTCAPAGAATLSLAEGQVLVNTGNGFRQATVGQQLKAGDRVMVGPGGGNATISYDFTCVARVPTGQVVTVSAGTPCNANSPTASPEAGIANPTGIPNTALIAGGVALAVGAGIGIYQLTKPSSP